MSNLLSQASLVMIPSGYKEDVVYSQIPTNGNGDLSFTRASNGTRINSAGLVEVCPWNLVRYSEDFDNTAWVKSNATVTANQTTAPNGTNTADKIEISSATNATVQQGVNSDLLVSGLPCTFTVYLKSVSGTGKVGIRSGQTGLSSLFNFTNEWQQFTWTFNSAVGTEIPQFCNNTLVAGADSAPTFYAWGAQLNIGSTAKPYFPTTDRLNVPRLTYQNGGGGCPSLLLEKQSTNLLPYSEQFDNAAWTKNGATITADSTISPDGTQNADTLTGASGNYRIYQIVSGLSSVDYTFSVFAKKGTANLIWFDFVNVGDGPSFNFTTKTWSSSSGWTTSYEEHANGWFRLIATKASNTTSAGLGIKVGAVNETVYLWGTQMEASSYKTSYIPTTSSSATRVADACFKTGISSLIGQSEGFIAGEVEGLTNSYGSQSTIMSVSDGTTQNRVMFSFNATTGYVTPRIFKAGSTIFVNDFAITLTQKIKFAIGWGGGRAVCYVNGTQVQETTGLTFFSSGTLTRLGADDGAGSNIGIGKVGEYILGTTNLTNAQLQSLTL